MKQSNKGLSDIHVQVDTGLYVKTRKILLDDGLTLRLWLTAQMEKYVKAARLNKPSE